MAQHAYAIKYVPSANLDEAVWSDSLSGINPYVNFSLLLGKKPFITSRCEPLHPPTTTPLTGLCYELSHFRDQKCSW